MAASPVQGRHRAAGHGHPVKFGHRHAGRAAVRARLGHLPERICQPRRVRNTLKPILEVLAGIPTVVYGFFALQFMTPLLQTVFGGNTVEIFNVASAGLVMGIMILPLVASMSEDALSAVPRSLREASYGLGSTRLETTVRVVLPAAVSGIVAAFIIAISRAIGETMIMAIAAGAAVELHAEPVRVRLDHDRLHRQHQRRRPGL